MAYEYALEIDKQSNGTLVKKNAIGQILRPKKFVAGVFCDIVKKHGIEQQQSNELSGENLSSSLLPRPGDIVVHLRLGDVLDRQMLWEETEDAFNYGLSIVPSQIRNMLNVNTTAGWWSYAKSKCYYEMLFKKLKEAKTVAAKQPQPPEDEDEKRVIIVGSVIHNLSSAANNISFQYTKLVQQFFVDHGYEVIMRMDGLPDNDMVWMSHAAVFVAAGGRFSEVASECVKYFGGLVFDRLDEPCLNAPRPNIAMKEYSWEKDGWHGKDKWSGNKNYPPEDTIW